MFILYAIPIGIVAGYLLGGRLERLGDLRLRWVPLALFGLLVQIVLFTDALGSPFGDASPAIYVASNLLVFAAVLRNVQVPGMAIAAVGAGCNLLAIVANGGYMPADPAAVAVGRARWARLHEQHRPHGPGAAVPDRHLRDADVDARGQHLQHRRRPPRHRGRGDDRARDAPSRQIRRVTGGPPARGDRPARPTPAASARTRQATGP